MRIRGMVLLLAGMALVGCARENRWTLNGTPPSPLPPDHLTPRRQVVYIAPGTVRLSERDGVCYVQNSDPKRNALATVLLTPLGSGANGLKPREMQLLVPPGGEMRVGLNTDKAGVAWRYTLLGAEYR